MNRTTTTIADFEAAIFVLVCNKLLLFHITGYHTLFITDTKKTLSSYLNRA